MGTDVFDHIFVKGLASGSGRIRALRVGRPEELPASRLCVGYVSCSIACIVSDPT